MATFVLIHGGWLGGWCWRFVTPPLRAAGHAVYTPTCTGLGERVHLAHPDVDLETHIQDIVNVLMYEDLHAVILAGWSYGGRVIAGVADRLPERIAHLVYLDAGIPEDNLAGGLDDDALERVRTEGDGWRLPAPPEPRFNNPTNRPGAYIEDATIRHWAVTKFTAQPVKTFTQALRLTNPRAGAIPRTYSLWNVGKSAEERMHTRQRVEAELGWHYQELATGHLGAFTAPHLVTDGLLEVV